jgi:hypothetical protein
MTVLLHVKRVNDTIQWYTKGCSCKKGCLTNKCSCRRSKGDGQTGYCRPGCKCINSQITDRMLSVDQPKSVRGGRDMTLSIDCCQYFETQRHLFQCNCRASAFGSISKLILCTYFSKHRAAFQPAVSVQELVTKLSSSDKSDNSTLILLQYPR